MEIVAYIIALLVPALALYLMSLLDLYGTGKYETFFICMGWGATIAFGLSYTVNTFFIDNIGFSYVSRFTAPVVEEVFKSIILWYFVTRPRFRYLVDGAVYGFAAGTGFAVMENFFYIRGNDAGALGIAISRVLTASLMHATASGLVGIGMGRLRRSVQSGPRKYTWPIIGMLSAVILHGVYNNIVSIEGLQAQFLVLLGILIGIGGSVIIGVIINQGLAEEKENFRHTLGLDVGVTGAETSAVQQLGTNAMEQILKDLSDFFGPAKADKIRQLLVMQANIGILQRNLNAPASDRMKAAWRAEVAELREKSDKLRNEIGLYVMSFLRGIFPTDDTDMWNAISTSAAEYDPGHVHKFDVFMLAGGMLGTDDIQRMEEMGRQLQAIDMFSHVDLADLENLSRAIVSRRFKNNALLFNQGDSGDAMYMIQSGAIDIYIVDEQTKSEKFIRTYNAGKVVGEMSLLDGQPRSATARTNGPTEVMVLRRSHFNMFVTSRPRVMLAVLRFLSDRVRYTTKIVEDAINNASAIARGDYGAVRDWQPERRELDTAEIAVSQLLFAEAGALDAEEAVAAAPQVLGGLFSALASALEEREAQAQS